MTAPEPEVAASPHPDVVVLSDGTEIPVVPPRPRPFLVDLLVGYYALASLVTLFAFLVAVRAPGLGGGGWLLLIGLGLGLTAILLTTDRIGWRLAVLHASGITIAGIVGLDGGAHASSLQLAVGATMLLILTRPSFRRFYRHEAPLPTPA